MTFLDFYRPSTYYAHEAAKISLLKCQVHFHDGPYATCLFADRRTWSDVDEARKKASQLKFVGTDLYIYAITVQFALVLYIFFFYNNVNGQSLVLDRDYDCLS